jgi:DNA-binding MarR family transcriptional regulator
MGMLHFIERGGRAFLTRRLRRLANILSDEVRQWFPDMHIDVPARSVATLLFLLEHPGRGVTEIAAQTGVSHPLVTRIVRTLEARGLVEQSEDASDGRRRSIGLTGSGRTQVRRLKEANRHIANAYGRLFEEAGIDLFAAVERMEALLDSRSFQRRLRDASREAAPAESRTEILA